MSQLRAALNHLKQVSPHKGDWTQVQSSGRSILATALQSQTYSLSCMTLCKSICVDSSCPSLSLWATKHGLRRTTCGSYVMSGPHSTPVFLHRPESPLCNHRAGSLTTVSPMKMMITITYVDPLGYRAVHVEHTRLHAAR